MSQDHDWVPDSCSAGPMFQKYAAVLRGGQQHQQEKGSIKYVTTIFCIVSGIIKLSKLMKLPPDRWLNPSCFNFPKYLSLSHINFHNLQLLRFRTRAMLLKRSSSMIVSQYTRFHIAQQHTLLHLQDCVARDQEHAPPRGVSCQKCHELSRWRGAFHDEYDTQ